MRFVAPLLLYAFVVAVPTSGGEALPGTVFLDWPESGGDLADRLMDGAHAFADRVIRESVERRTDFWQLDFSSEETYLQSLCANRDHFKRIIGVLDAERAESVAMEIFGEDRNPALVAETDEIQVFQVRWSVLDGVSSEGLLLLPKRPPTGCLIAIPDADQTPEQLVGLRAGDNSLQTHLQESAAEGEIIIVPTLIDRKLHLGPNGDDRRLEQSRQSHREWIYRQAFHLGRHIIGYEVQKTLAAVEWAAARHPELSTCVEGTGEGALIAFYAGACDQRIDSVRLHGYFGSRQAVWSEPIYRNVFGLLRRFGDAEIACLIAPRELHIFPAVHPRWADSKGEIPPFSWHEAQAEWERIPAPMRHHAHLHADIASDDETEPPCLRDRRDAFDPTARHNRMLRELEEHVQRLIQRSDDLRKEQFLYQAEPRLRPGSWSTERRHATLQADNFLAACQQYRERFDAEAMGRFAEPRRPLNPRSRKLLETDQWTAYDVVLDVYPELFAWGVLVLPKGIKPGERRPVVVCQHGRNGLPLDTINTHKTAYNDFAARLAEQGFITFAPHNLYRGEDRYRWLDRKANSVGCTLFSFIIASHRQIVAWLRDRPDVDPDRIAFYGLSYGGESAVRIPPVVEDYCLSVCSGDFNQWTRKVAETDFPNGFMKSIEWEMPYWNLGTTFDYAEMAYLIFPRPFMVERGHHDRVSVDPWVAYEYARVRWLYAQFGMPDRTQIEYFQGGHSINGQASFDFLHRHLDWPVPADVADNGVVPHGS